MQKKYIKNVCITILLMTVFTNYVDAQRRGGRGNRTNTGNTTPSNTTTNPRTTSNNRTDTNPAYNSYGNTPIEVDNNDVAGLDTIIRRSLRNDNAIERNLVKDRTPLPYQHIREDDAIFRERVWREIDIREKVNLPFRYSADEDNGNQRFITILMNAIRKEEVEAFDASVDDRFTTPTSWDKIQDAVAGKVDTTPVYSIDDPTKIDKYKVVRNEFNPDDIIKYRLKEEWVFDKQTSRLYVRILGIAPLKTLYRPDGTERGSTPMFWVYYPNLRATLAKYEVYNPKNFGARMSWEELFESRMFSSYITKSTIDNASNKTLAQSIKDPLFRLLEGEKIKDKIFNYEQDLWSY